MNKSDFPSGVVELEEHHPAGKDILLKPGHPYIGDLAYWSNSHGNVFSEGEASAIIFRNVSELTVREACAILRRHHKK